MTFRFRIYWHIHFVESLIWHNRPLEGIWVLCGPQSCISLHCGPWWHLSLRPLLYYKARVFYFNFDFQASSRTFSQTTSPYFTPKANSNGFQIHQPLFNMLYNSSRARPFKDMILLAKWPSFLWVQSVLKDDDDAQWIPESNDYSRLLAKQSGSLWSRHGWALYCHRLGWISIW